MKTLISWLIYLTILAFAALLIIPNIVITESITPIYHDDRVGKLGQFFTLYEAKSKHSCPAKLYIKDFLAVSDVYKLDFRLLPAISIAESTCFQHGLYNNYFGVGSATSLEHYNTPIQGIERAAQILVKYGITRYGPNKDKYPAEIQRMEEQIK